MVALERVAGAGFGIDGVAELHQHGLALPRALHRRPEQGVRAVGDQRLHGAAGDLRDEHARPQPARGVDRHPLPVILGRHRLLTAERAGGHRQRHQRNAGYVAFLRRAGNDPQARRLRFRIGPVRVPQPPVRLRRQPPGHHLLERRLVHVAHENILVLVHPFREQAVDQGPKHQLELAFGIDRRAPAQLIVADRRLHDLIEEELVGVVEVGAEPPVDDIDQPRQRDLLLMGGAAADFGRSIERRALLGA